MLGKSTLSGKETTRRRQNIISLNKIISLQRSVANNLQFIR